MRDDPLGDRFDMMKPRGGLPLGDVALRGDIVMRNLIGDEVDDWLNIVARPGEHLHLYGKTESRPGRKMGHVTTVRRK